jgi:hypothetical protein
MHASNEKSHSITKEGVHCVAGFSFWMRRNRINGEDFKFSCSYIRYCLDVMYPCPRQTSPLSV